MIIVAIGILIVAVGLIAISSSKQDPAQTNAQSFSNIQSDVAAGAKLYDVRTKPEYTAGHFENAENWPLQDMQAEVFPSVAKNTKIYVYCQSGNRSSQAATLLKKAGFTDVVDLGGLQDVQNAGGTLQNNEKVE